MAMSNREKWVHCSAAETKQDYRYEQIQNFDEIKKGFLLFAPKTALIFM